MIVDDIAEMAEAYIVAALFTADEELVSPKSGEFNPSPYMGSVSAEMVAQSRDVCEAFFRNNAADLASYPAENAGHDLWYTRNGHGCGFWEADHCTDDEGERLTSSAKKLGECYLYLGDDGQFYTE